MNIVEKILWHWYHHSPTAHETRMKKVPIIQLTQIRMKALCTYILLGLCDIMSQRSCSGALNQSGTKMAEKTVSIDLCQCCFLIFFYPPLSSEAQERGFTRQKSHESLINYLINEPHPFSRKTNQLIYRDGKGEMRRKKKQSLAYECEWHLCCGSVAAARHQISFVFTFARGKHEGVGTILCRWLII